MKALILFILLWTPVCLFLVYKLPPWFDEESGINLGIILWLIGFLVGLYYLVARKWRA